MHIISVVLSFLAMTSGLQLGAVVERSPSLTRVHVGRSVPPRCQFGERERKALTRDSEPDDFFKTNMGERSSPSGYIYGIILCPYSHSFLFLADDMSDAEKIRSPAVIIGLAILILPFVAGIIALNVYK